jgi:hypothetical protein
MPMGEVEHHSIATLKGAGQDELFTDSAGARATSACA